MTSLNSSFKIHSPSIPTPTESDSSFLTLLARADHQIVPLSQCFPLARFELIEEKEENEEMSTNSQNLANSDLERCLFAARRGTSEISIARMKPNRRSNKFAPAGPVTLTKLCYVS